MRQIVKTAGRGGATVEPVITWVILTLVFAIAGPFGSFEEMGLVRRIWVWSGIVGIGVVAALALRAGLHRLGVLRHRRSGTFAIALFCTLLLTWPLHAYVEAAFTPTAALTLPEVALFVFVCSLRVSTVDHLAAQARPDPAPNPAQDLPASPPAADPPPTAAAQAMPGPEPLPSEPPVSGPAAPEPAAAPLLPRIVQRLDPAVQGRLLAISVSNHHVEVRTTVGQASLLLRLADAMEETEGEPGAQIHRSHWVAWWAVSRAEKDGARFLLTLTDGTRLPVSRSHREKLEERGLLAAAAANGIARTVAPVSSASAPGAISAASSGAAQDRPPVKVP